VVQIDAGWDDDLLFKLDEVQQIVEQGAHAFPAGAHETEVPLGMGGQIAGVVLHQQ